MRSATFWHLFCETGDLMYYLLYREALVVESAGEKTA